MEAVSEGARASVPFERTPPQNIEAEMSVLGGMLLSKDAIAEVSEVLRADDFYKPSHATIFRSIMDIFGAGEPADALTVSNDLQRHGDLERIGGLPYLHSLVSTVPTAANAVYYAEIVREQAQLRSLVEAGTRIVQLGYTTDGADVENLVNEAQAEVYAISERGESNDFASLRDIAPGLLDELEANENRDGRLLGIPTGFAELDNLLNGLRENQMIIVAARPGAGKSTFAMDLARSAALRHDLPTAYFTLEMTRNELAMRMLAAETDIFLDKMIKGNMSTDDWHRVGATMTRVGDKPLIIDDTPNLTMAEIRAKCRRMKQQYDLKLIIIDYLQLLTSGGRAPESRQQEVSEFSRSIKLLAKELSVPIVAVAQLNRNPEARQDKRPQVSDLRESGSLEQDADVVILIHRADMFRDQGEPPSGEAEIIVGKQRSGPTGMVKLAFRGAVSCFADMAPDI